MMAADLIVRTDKAEYTSGDTIHGAVYLKISGPTSAYGIQIKFYGYETFMYASKRNAADDEVVHDTKEYIASDQITLYEFEDPIALGQYVFPFQKRLPMELPGSTQLRSSEKSTSEWKVEIAYGVEVSLMGAKGIKVRQNLIVTQPLLEVLLGRSEMEEYVETKSERLRTWVPIILVDTKICIHMDRQLYHTGENLSLKLDIETSGLFKPKIESILFQLLRDLRITFNKSPPKGSLSQLKPGMSESLSWLISRRGPARSDEDFSADRTIPNSGYVHPEGNSFVVQTSRLVDIEGTKLVNGIQELLVPLKDDRGSDVPATTIGNSIWLMYSLKVTIKFERNDPVVLHLPVCSVLPRFPEWYSWRPGDWVYECQVMTMEKSPCFVSPEVLESVQFSTLPSFQVV